MILKKLEKIEEIMYVEVVREVLIEEMSLEGYIAFG